MQLRSVVETESRVDDIFDFFLHDWKSTRDYTHNYFPRALVRHSSSKMQRSTHKQEVFPFMHIEQNEVTTIQYRKIPLPWYVREEKG